MWVLYIFWRSNPCLSYIGKYVFPYGWFSFHFNTVFFSCAEAFYFDEVPFVYSFLYVLCTPMYIAAQFTIAKYWKQPKCPSVNEWIKKLVHLHNGIMCSRKKEGAPTLCNSMDGTRECYAKWGKPGSERQIPYDLTYKWNLINKTNKQAKYNQRHWNKEQTDSDQRGGRRR